VNHTYVKKHLADYLEGDLALDDRAHVDAHLDHCEECAQEVTGMQQTIRLLRLLPEPQTPPMIAANVMRRIRAGENRPGFVRRILGGFGAILEPSFMLPASAVAAAALVVMVVQGPGEGGVQAFWKSVSPANSPGVETPAVERAQTARRPGIPSLEAMLPTPFDRSARSFGRPPARTVASSSPGSEFGSEARSEKGWAIVDRSRAAGSAAARRRLETDVLAAPGHRLLSDPILALPIPKSLVPAVYGANRTARTVIAPSLATLVRDRFAGGAPSALSVSQTLAPRRLGALSSGGGDPRDAWLARGLEEPVDFARFLGEKSLAEQELWVARLSERAAARGLLGELVLSLQASGNEVASWLADDFLAYADRMADRMQTDGDSTGEPIAR